MKLVVKGPKVQDVGYRVFLYGLAEDTGLERFYAYNRGRDEVVALADGDPGALEEFLSRAQGDRPSTAVVESVTMEEYGGRVPPIESFHRRLTAEQLGKIVESGLALIEKQDLMLGRQEETLGEMREMRRLQEETLGEMREMRRHLVSVLDERVARLEREVAEIKARLRVVSGGLSSSPGGDQL